MSIKTYAYRAHAHLKSCGASSLTRSHVYELLAASAGYRTHAAFQSDAVWCDFSWHHAEREPDVVRLQARCLELGLDESRASATTAGLLAFLSQSGHVVARFEDVLDAVEGEDALDRDLPNWLLELFQWPVVESVSSLHTARPVLLESLEMAAARGVAEAHYAIARLIDHVGSREEGESDEAAVTQMHRTGIWSDAYASFEDVVASPHLTSRKFRHHLLAAAALGHIPALEWSAERYNDARILRMPPSDEMQPWLMALIANDNRDEELVRYWLTVGARQGDVKAMRELIEEHDETIEQAWVWMHLSRLLGEDLSVDRHRAINEDGSDYDDDVGGPAYVGGEEGIRLEPLPDEVDRQARQEAERLFASIQSQQAAD